MHQQENLSQTREILHQVASRYSEIPADVRQALKRNRDQSLTLAVVGAFSRGKSTFVNALLGVEILPTSILPTTAVYTRISYGDQASARLLYEGNEARTIAVESVKQYVATNEKQLGKVSEIHVSYPSPYLKEGLVILDAPGIDSVKHNHHDIAIRCVEEADAILFVVSCEPPVGEVDCNFIDEVCSRTCNIVFVQTHIDKYQDWDERVEFNQSALRERTGLKEAVIYPISSTRLLQYHLQRNPEDLSASKFEPLDQELRAVTGTNRHKLILEGERRRLSHQHRKITETIEMKMAAVDQRLKELTSQEQDIKAKTKALDQQKLALKQTAYTYLQSSIQPIQNQVHNILDKASSGLQAYSQNATAEQIIANGNGQILRLLGEARAQIDAQSIGISAAHLQKLLQTRGITKTPPTALANFHPSLTHEKIDLSLPRVVEKPASNRLGTGALLGGAIGLVVAATVPIIGLAVGAAIGGALGAGVKNPEKLNLEATRNNFIRNAAPILSNYRSLWQKEVETQVSEWGQVCSNWIADLGRLELLPREQGYNRELQAILHERDALALEMKNIKNDLQTVNGVRSLI